MFDDDDDDITTTYIGMEERRRILAEKDGRGVGGKLRISVTAFVRAVAIAAARLLPVDSETVRGGLASMCHDVDGTFNVAGPDFKQFARHVTTKLSTINLRDYAMMRARFYMCEHGLRLWNEETRWETLIIRTWTSCSCIAPTI